MSDTRFESELIKSLHRLDNILSKAQIEDKRTGHPRDHWGDGEVHRYDSDEDTAWQDSIEEDGTDYDGPKKKKKMKKGASRGNLYKADDPSEEEEEEVEVEETTEKSVRTGVEVSDFLGELTKAIAIYCDDLENAVVKSISELHVENGEVVKSLAHNLSVMSDVISGSKENIMKYAEGPARGPKSYGHMSKSVPSQDAPANKNQILGLLMKGVEAGVVSPLEVIKCEQYGPQAVNQNVLKSLTA